jgi:hypothetical protein
LVADDEEAGIIGGLQAASRPKTSMRQSVNYRTRPSGAKLAMPRRSKPPVVAAMKMRSGGRTALFRETLAAF